MGFSGRNGRRTLLGCMLALTSTGNPVLASTAYQDATASGHIGLYNAADFRLTTGQCADCNIIPQALWYFQDDIIATPKNQPAGFDATQRTQDDVRSWASQHPDSSDNARPPLLWLGSPTIATGTLSADGTYLLDADNQSIPFSVTPKIPANLSYYDASSVRHFAGRSLRLRGTVKEDGFVARTIWPADYALDFDQLTLQPLGADESLASIVRRDGNQPAAPLAARILWQKQPDSPRNWNNKAVLAIMLNGAQGDDDEAHGGHFAIATGAFGPHGEWDNWLVNNFYNLGSFSEKGIVAAMLPMDAYMADLNSGQAWYRPSYMLVAILNQPRAPHYFQSAVSRVYNHFYRHDFEYRHTTANCTGISMDTLRSLGWQIPQLGPTDALKAAVALPYMSIKDMSLASGENAFDYLMAEQTNLYPFVAFEAAGRDILQRISTGKAGTTGLDNMLANDIEALLYVRIPQFPSSRAFGQAPIASLDEYMSRVPEDRADWKIVPVEPREFPQAMRDPMAPQDPSPPSQRALYAYSGVLAFGAMLLWRRFGPVKKR